MRTYWADYVRFLIFILYGLTIGHIAWIVRLYWGFGKSLLPRHILTVGTMFILVLTEVVWQNATRVGQPYTHYIPINLFLVSGSLYAMVNMRQHIMLRKKKAWFRSPDPDPTLDDLQEH